MTKTALTQLLKNSALSEGFDACGIAAVSALPGEAARLNKWLSEGYHAGMDYMERNKEKRENPAVLMDGAKSVVVLLMNYKPPQTQLPAAPQIAYFAYGRDYHDWLREKLHAIIRTVQTNFPGVYLRGFVDSAPVFEKAWASRAGLGWIGKNNLLISPRFGSFVFLATLILDAPLDYDTPQKMPACGNCTKCTEACPASALREPYLLDANRCIAYQTIENKGETTIDTSNYCFGCDICQRACPWNEKTPPHAHADWPAIPEILAYTAADWARLDEPAFNRIFAQSPLRRAGFHKIKSSLCNCKHS